MWFRKYIWLKLLTKTIKGNYENVTEEEEEEEEEEKDCVTPFIYFICLLGYKTVKWDLGKNSWSKGNATFVNLVVNLFKEVKKKKRKIEDDSSLLRGQLQQTWYIYCCKVCFLNKRNPSDTYAFTISMQSFMKILDFVNPSIIQVNHLSKYSVLVFQELLDKENKRLQSVSASSIFLELCVF